MARSAPAGVGATPETDGRLICASLLTEQSTMHPPGGDGQLVQVLKRPSVQSRRIPTEMNRVLSCCAMQAIWAHFVLL